jgi:hypothetical protein
MLPKVLSAPVLPFLGESATIERMHNAAEQLPVRR